jgi:hypothetical protein
VDLGLNYLVGIWTHLDTLGVCVTEERVEPRERERERVIVLLYLGLEPVLVSRE